MRRSSNAQLRSQTSEPVIVVEDNAENDPSEPRDSSTPSSEEESPSMNPYLLSPFARDIRKHSLPTPQCSGITASQVRRLSERGENAGPGPRQAEFLATLSTAPAPSPGGRRHSVVTISKVPATLFGRNRRESVAAYPSFPGRILPNRRESIACPPSTEARGSVHNLQLDIMDDIVQARKVRMKVWNTSNEKVCEVQPLDETGGVQRYTNSSARRYSDFVGTTLAPIPSGSAKRRASELPKTNETSASKQFSTGIVCSNTDLISILSTLTSSAMEIHQCEAPIGKTDTGRLSRSRTALQKMRSNSFDVSVLREKSKRNATPVPSNWFIKRHQPISSKSENKDESSNKVVWDERSGSIVDPEALGSAIEGFLRKTDTVASKGTSPNKNKSASSKPKTSWFSNNKSEDDGSESCDSSICSTLKDLFVK